MTNLNSYRFVFVFVGMLMVVGAKTIAAEPDATALEKAVEKTVWQWLDANIGSQKRLAASLTGQRLSGAEIGSNIQLSPAQILLFQEQLGLLEEIKAARNVAIAKQYMLVHTLMTLGQAEQTMSLLSNKDDPRRAGVLQQISTAKQLLVAIGYTKASVDTK